MARSVTETVPRLVAPVSGVMFVTDHVLVVVLKVSLYTPPGVVPSGSPRTATYTVFGSVGLTTMAPNLAVGNCPGVVIRLQLAPALVVCRIPPAGPLAAAYRVDGLDG